MKISSAFIQTSNRPWLLGRTPTSFIYYHSLNCLPYQEEAGKDDQPIASCVSFTGGENIVQNLQCKIINYVIGDYDYHIRNLPTIYYVQYEIWFSSLIFSFIPFYQYHVSFLFVDIIICTSETKIKIVFCSGSEAPETYPLNFFIIGHLKRRSS